MVSRFNRPYKLPSVTVRLSTNLAEPGKRAVLVGELFLVFSLSFSSFVIGLIDDARDKALNELRLDT
jgi:hypothetical protein